MPRNSAWIAHVKGYAAANGISYREAIKAAGSTYQRAAPEVGPSVPSDVATQQVGAGIFSDIYNKAKTAITSRLEARPLNVTNVLKEYGSQQITRISICKEPIQSVIRGALNLASGGDLDRTVKEKGYDGVFHLFSQLTLANGVVIRLEKNQRVSIAIGPAKMGANAKCEEAVLPKPTTLAEFIDRGEKLGNSHGSFWRYSAYNDNCQKFIRDLLNASGVTALDGFIMQDAGALVKSGWLRGISRIATDAAAAADYIMKGGARKSNMAAFKTYKAQIIGEMGAKALSDGQLSAKARQLFGGAFRGVYSQDTVPVGHRGMYIVNTDTHGQAGTHWVGAVETPDTIYIYDSFARHASHLLPILEAKLNRKHIEEHEKLNHPTQWGDTEVCGQLVLAWMCMVRDHGIDAAMNF